MAIFRAPLLPVLLSTREKAFLVRQPGWIPWVIAGYICIISLAQIVCILAMLMDEGACKPWRWKPRGGAEPACRSCIHLPLMTFLAGVLSTKFWLYANRRGESEFFKITDVPSWKPRFKALLGDIGSKSRPSASSSVDGYPYRPLKHASNTIRLLYLEPPGQVDGPLRARLIAENLDEASDFDALSYVWNQPAAIDPSLSTIILNGQPKISIKPNLFAALRELRDAGLTRGLWVDNLCINQDDNNECEKQVPLMASIYSRATNVHVWLGEQEPGDERGLAALNTWRLDWPAWNESISINWDEVRFLLWEPPDTVTLFWPENIHANCNAIKGILKKPYWARQWIVQELILTKRAILHCGNASCLWTTAARALDSLRFVMIVPTTLALEAHDLVHSRSYHRVLDFARYYLRWHSYTATLSRLSAAWGITNPRYPDVFRIAADFPGKQASDSRDHVFGLLGICSGTRISADYTASAVEIYRRSVQHTLVRNRDLFFLSLCEARDASDFASMKSEGWPSWVPDLRREPSLRYDRRQFFASGARQSMTSLNPAGNLLVHGLLIDTIQVCFTDASQVPSVGPELHKSLLRLILIDIIPRSPTDPKAVQIIDRFAKLLEPGAKFVDGFDVGEDYMKSQMKVKVPSAVFVTHGGRAGSTPFHTEEDDVVAILFGARVPTVLRPDTNGCYRVVGDCLIDGFMYGETLQSDEAKPMVFELT